MNENNELLSAAYNNVTLTTSAIGLEKGAFIITGYHLPAGQLGPRVAKYTRKIEGRTEYDAASRSAQRRFGRSIKAANALFEALKPNN